MPNLKWQEQQVARLVTLGLTLEEAECLTSVKAREPSLVRAVLRLLSNQRASVVNRFSREVTTDDMLRDQGAIRSLDEFYNFFEEMTEVDNAGE